MLCGIVNSPQHIPPHLVWMWGNNPWNIVSLTTHCYGSEYRYA
jgi:hypothetical protein